MAVGRPVSGVLFGMGRGPLMIYHGQEDWSAPRSLDELIGGPKAAFEYGVRMNYPVLDIARVPDESLARDPFLQSVLGLLKYSRRRDFEEKLEVIPVQRT